MTSVMPSAMPCIRCKTRLVKTGGITGMCKACRLADPVMAEVQRGNHAAMRSQMNEWLSDNFEPDPRLGPGYLRPKKGADIF